MADREEPRIARRGIARLECVTCPHHHGDIAVFAAMRRASSPVSSLAAAERLPLGSQTWFSFFNGRYGSAAALPTTAPFFFETETAGLMFVPHRWPQSFPWWLFCRLPREDAAADYECAHDCPENSKLHLLHCGVLRSPNTTTSHYKAFRVSSLAQRPPTTRSSLAVRTFKARRSWRAFLSTRLPSHPQRQR